MNIGEPAPGEMTRRARAQPALSENLFNNLDLMAAVLAPANLRRAWQRVKSNKGAPGIDGITIEDFSAHARQHWRGIRQAIEQGNYQPTAVRRVTIPKPNGGQRLLGIPTVTDRVIQQAIAQVLTPEFDPRFSESSFGFRPGRNAHMAVRQVQTYIKAGYKWAVDIDLAKFFDTVNHDLLMSLLGRRFRDKRLLALIGKYLRAGVLVGEQIQPSEIGTPQGGPLWPLLANILLDQLDKELERRGHRFARYADDLILLVKSQRAGERVKRSLTRYLETSLKLTVNEAKSQVAPVEQCSFLSFTFRRGKLRWTDEAFEDFKHRIRELTGRSWGVSMAWRMKKLGQYLRGGLGYFGISQYYRPIPEIDEWLRRRIRMCYWKQWRWARTKIRNLLALGVRLKAAIQQGVSSNSYWRMARTPVTQFAMSNAWLKDQGLVSVRDLWMKAQGYAV